MPKYINDLYNIGDGDFIQIRPQRVRVRVRVGHRARVRFRVSQSKDYPVDLYYLMDLSNSMSDDRDNIVRIHSKIVIRNKIIFCI